MHKSRENRTAPHRLHLLVCYTYMLMVYVGDVMLYLYANGIFFFLNIQVEIGKYYLYLYAIVSQIFSCCKCGFFRLKLTFGLVQSDLNEFSPNRKTAPTPHRTKPNCTAPKLILIGAGVSACNRKIAL